MKATNDADQESDELSLKDLILTLQDFYREVLRHWYWVVLLAGLFAALLLLNAYFTPRTYTAELTFMVNEEEGGGIGGISAILGQFGLGRGNKGGKFNLDKILELARSRRIVQEVLFERRKIEWEGSTKEDYLANLIIDLYDFHEKWADSDDEALVGFLFKHDQLDKFGRVENKAFKAVYHKVVGNENVEGLLKTSYNEDTGIMNFKTKTEAEVVSLWLTSQLFDKISTFYVEKTIEKQQQTYEVVSTKVDSIRQVLDVKQLALANFQDSNLGVWTRKDKVEEQRLRRDIQMLMIVYGEAIKNLEIADFTLKSKTPFIQLIDAPIAPLKPKAPSRLRAILIGGFLGGFLSVLWIIGRKIYRNAMA